MRVKMKNAARCCNTERLRTISNYYPRLDYNCKAGGNQGD